MAPKYSSIVRVATAALCVATAATAAHIDIDSNITDSGPQSSTTPNETDCDTASYTSAKHKVAIDDLYSVADFPAKVLWADAPYQHDGLGDRYTFKPELKSDGSSVIHDTNLLLNLIFDERKDMPSEREHCTVTPRPIPADTLYTLACSNSAFMTFTWPQGGIKVHPLSTDARTADLLLRDGLQNVDVTRLPIYGDIANCPQNTGLVWLLEMLAASDDINTQLRSPRDVASMANRPYGYTKIEFNDLTNVLKLTMKADYTQPDSMAYVGLLHPKKNIYGWKTLARKLAEVTLPPLDLQKLSPLTTVLNYNWGQSQTNPFLTTPDQHECIIDLYNRRNFDPLIIRAHDVRYYVEKE